MIAGVMAHIHHLLLWGFIATCAMTIVMEGSRHFGWSRISLPFLLGTCLSSRRNSAELIGFILYIVGGDLFALFYALIFETLQASGWWRGLVIGLLHGSFLLIAILPLAHTVHPRIASAYDGPDAKRRIEPPGFMGLNYGRGTPVVTLSAQMIYGCHSRRNVSHIRSGHDIRFRENRHRYRRFGGTWARDCHRFREEGAHVGPYRADGRGVARCASGNHPCQFGAYGHRRCRYGGCRTGRCRWHTPGSGAWRVSISGSTMQWKRRFHSSPI